MLRGLVTQVSGSTTLCVENWSIVDRSGTATTHTTPGVSPSTPTILDVDNKQLYLGGITQYGGCDDLAGGGISFLFKDIDTGETARTLNFLGASFDFQPIFQDIDVEWPCQIIDTNTTLVNGRLQVANVITYCM